MNHTGHLRLAVAAIAGIAVVGLFGFPLGTYAPLALILLLCPLMMYFMMRGLGHGGASSHARHQGPPGHRLSDAVEELRR